MSTRATIHVADPESVNLTVSLTMSLREWKKVLAQMATEYWPSSRVGAAISKAVGVAEKHFTETHEYVE